MALCQAPSSWKIRSALFAGMKFDDALVYCAELGLEAIELPVDQESVPMSES